jgi:hypothetical protein
MDVDAITGPASASNRKEKRKDKKEKRKGDERYAPY